MVVRRSVRASLQDEALAQESDLFDVYQTPTP
jgi:hypothetical protein